MLGPVVNVLLITSYSNFITVLEGLYNYLHSTDEEAE